MSEGKDEMGHKLLENSSAGEAETSTPTTKSNPKYGTVSDFQDESKSKSNYHHCVVILTILSAIGGFLFGYDTGVISGAMLALKEVFYLNYFWQELIVSITIAAAAVFALVAGPLNDFFGRRKVVILASIIFAAGALLMGLANSKELLLIGRLVVGLAIGLTSMTVPMYISECSPIDHRGKLTVINNVFIAGGQMVASIMDGILFSDHENGWRYMLGLAGLPAVIQLIGFVFMPESPRWLVIKGRDAEAEKVLAGLRSPDVDVTAEIDAIRSGHKEAVEAAKSEGDSAPVLIRMLRHPPTRRALILGCGLQMFQQLVGINTVMYYSATIVQMAGVRDSHKAVWIAAGTATVNFVASTSAIYLVDYLGRRKLTLGSLLGVLFSLIVLAVGFQVSAFTSLPVTVHPTSPSASYSHCDKMATCSSCVRRQDCGFCFSPPPPTSSLLAINGSCLPTRMGFEEKSLYGPCDGTNNSTSHIWNYSFCPSTSYWVPILGLILYLVSFSPGMGPMAWTVNSEIFPNWARSTGIAMSTGFNWTFNLLVSMTFLSLTEGLTRYGTFWLYSVIAFIGFSFLFVALPETKGKTLEEVEILFQKPWNCFCFKF